MLRRTSSQCPPTRLRPGSYWQPTPIVEAWPFASITSAQTLPLVIGYLLGQPPRRHLRRATLRVGPQRLIVLHRQHITPALFLPATAAVVGHCRTPVSQLPRQRARQPPPRGRSSLGPVVLWCGRPPLPAHRLPAAAPSPPPIPGVGRAPGPERPRRDGCHRPGILPI